MTSARLSLKNPVSPPPQLCPGPSALPPQGLPGSCRHPCPQPSQSELLELRWAGAKRSLPHTPTAPPQAGPGQELTRGRLPMEGPVSFREGDQDEREPRVGVREQPPALPFSAARPQAGSPSASRATSPGGCRPERLLGVAEAFPGIL
ncbi:hypothetical protein HJG60_008411 [Phyllostomus discolor]|nr:hypothetical protein HJG60_008411 [Phyllostomus discolor]